MTYPAFRLATYASAALAGHAVDWGVLPEFAGETEWVFLVPGPNGYKLRNEPGAWIAMMRSLGARRAWFGFGPSADLRGEGVWTDGPEGSVFYRASGQPGEDGRIRVTFRGHPSPAPLPPEDVATASARLLSVLPMVVGYARDHRHGGFVSALEEALALLGGHQAPSPEVSDRFPPDIYPPEHVLLLAAAARGDVFGYGGMGSWYDFAPSDGDEFGRVTQVYAAALYPAFTASSRLEESAARKPLFPTQ